MSAGGDVIREIQSGRATLQYFIASPANRQAHGRTKPTQSGKPTVSIMAMYSCRFGGQMPPKVRQPVLRMKYCKNITIISLLLMVSCGRSSDLCDRTNFSAVRLEQVGDVIRLPLHRIIDSTRFDSETLFYRHLQSIDSSLNTFIKITQLDGTQELTLDELRNQQRTDILEGQDSIRLRQDTLKFHNGKQVGYLEFIVTRNGTRLIESRVFYHKNQKLVELWFFEKSDDKENLLIDCVLEASVIK